ncbi:DUF47 family protein [Candidatus Bathyarchaeota archaeon]|nr:DUF47 family protein [Candidatus Bathyarchaeota archaeon]
MSFLDALRGKPPEIRVLDLIEKHQQLSVAAADCLLKAIEAKMDGDGDDAECQIKDVFASEEEADVVRRGIENELASGILPPLSRADMARLTERLDEVPDWCKQSGRILEIMSMDNLPDDVRDIFVEQTRMTDKCVRALSEVVKLLYTDHEAALDACNAVEIIEHEIDNLYIETLRRFYYSRMTPQSLLLANELAEALEMIGDSCENAADLVRVVVVSTFL